MASSIFDDKTKRPTPAMLARALGAKAALWADLKTRVAAAHAPLTEEWVYGGNNYGWSLRLKRQKRAVVYLTPCDGYFRCAFALGEKAAAAAHESGLPAEVLRIIDDAPRYAEGRAVRIEIRAKKDLPAILKIAACKMAN